MCNSLLLPRKTEVVALGCFGCSGKLSRLLLSHVQALVADLLGAEPLVWLQHRLGGRVVLENAKAKVKAWFKLCTGEETRSSHFTFHLNTSSRTRCEAGTDKRQSIINNNNNLIFNSSVAV